MEELMNIPGFEEDSLQEFKDAYLTIRAIFDATMAELAEATGNRYIPKMRLTPPPPVIPEIVVPSTELFECDICFDEVAVGEGFLLVPCQHSLCRTCLDVYLTTLVGESRVLEIACPFHSAATVCSTRLGYNEIRKVVSTETMQRYETFTCREHLKEETHTRWCPNPRGCGAAVITDGSCGATIVCRDCSFRSCGWCGAEEHKGSCEAKRNWKKSSNAADRAFAKWAHKAKELKRCPKCKISIQKVEGCNHMTCNGCHHQFCWLCGGTYGPHHYDLINPLGCPGMQNVKLSTPASVGVKVGLALGVVVTSPLLIAAAVVAGPIYGGIRLHEYRKHKAHLKRMRARVRPNHLPI